MRTLTGAVLLAGCGAGIVSAGGDPTCDPTQRADCGYVGITQQECTDKGCCWQPVTPPGTGPWCFNKANQPPNPSQCHDDGMRRNCGYVGITAAQCQQRGCCWNPLTKGSSQPWCYHQNEAPFAGYMVSSQQPTATGMQISLTPMGNGSTVYGPPIQQVTVDVIEETETRLHVRITDAANERYEVPAAVLPRPAPPSGKPSSAAYSFSFTQRPFGFAVTRKSDGATLFNTTGDGELDVGPILFTDQFWELGTSLGDGASLFGLGEQSQSGGFRLVSGSTYTMWNRDQPAATTNQNLYGSHPFYLSLSPDGSAHGVFLLNSNGMDVDYETSTLTYRVIGGIPDFYFFTGPTPASVVQQYQEVIGMPHMPPYWGLGFHQCRYGYPNIDTVEKVVAGYAKAAIPLETMWNDIDYMNQYKDWTFDPTNYPISKMQAFVEQLHANGQRYVVIVDPGIFNQDPTYSPYENGLRDKIFITTAERKPCGGVVWPGPTYFPDFTHPNITAYWSASIDKFLDTLPIDGLWIDMNEPSNAFATGCASSASTADGHVAQVAAAAAAAEDQEGSHRHMHNHNHNHNHIHHGHHSGGGGGGGARGQRGHSRTRGQVRIIDPTTTTTTTTASTTATDSTTTPSVVGARGPSSLPPPWLRSPSRALVGTFDPNNPPYTINNCASGCPLDTKTLAPDALQYPYTLGDPINNHYNLHNLYGITEAIATRSALEKHYDGKRAFIITRSTFAGSGKHVGHWSGDNASTYNDMQYSINDMLNMAMFGVSLMGSDICGFLGNTNEELCARWIALGSFYTFSRNHNTKGAASQELYLWPTVANVSRTVISNRYRMMPYMYTYLYKAHTEGQTVWRPLFFEFPADQQTHGIGSQFMVGPAIMVSPVLAEGVNTVSAYFPSARWYDWWTGAAAQGAIPGTLTLDAPIDTIPVHIRGGYIVPTQQYAGSGSVIRTDPYEAVVALDASGAATGSLYVDDGETIDDSRPSVQVSLSASTSAAGVLTVGTTVSVASYAPGAALTWAAVNVYGLASQPSGATFNGSPLQASALAWNAQTSTLRVTVPSGTNLGAQWTLTVTQ